MSVTVWLNFLFWVWQDEYQDVGQALEENFFMSYLRLLAKFRFFCPLLLPDYPLSSAINWYRLPAFLCQRANLTIQIKEETLSHIKYLTYFKFLGWADQRHFLRLFSIISGSPDIIAFSYFNWFFTLPSFLT
jgi:hypothetical protein